MGKPKAKYNEAGEKQCFNYTNLQPLWAKDNISKGDKYNLEETKEKHEVSQV